MNRTFKFTLVAPAKVPQEWVYFAALQRPFRPDLMDQELGSWLLQKGLLKEKRVDVRVVFTELDNGTEFEWRVELCPTVDTQAQHSKHLAHGYVDRAAFMQQGSQQQVFAQHLCSNAMKQAFAWVDEPPVYH